MARPRSQETLERLQEAALWVFAHDGIHSARMGEVAKRAGIAHGTVYGYVAGKEALLWLALRVGDLPRLAELPLREPGRRALESTVEKRAHALHALPPLERALDRAGTPAGPEELGHILADHYDRARRTARELAFLERAAQERPLVRRHLHRERAALLDRMQRYLESRIALGWVEPVGDARVAGRVALDAVAHCARRHEEEPDPVFRPDSVARETVVTLAARGLLAQASRPPSTGGASVH